MEKEIEVPEGIDVSIEGNEILVKGPKGELKRSISPLLKAKVSENRILLKTESKKDTKRIKAVVGTWVAHIKNMFIGVTKTWEAKLKVVYSHFPVRQAMEGNKLLIQNFLGEKRPRIAKILEDVKVVIGKDEIVVTGIDLERVGQTCGNIEAATRVSGFDRRVFQDGIYITQKCRPLE